jgi:hypothetical protein
VSGSYNLLAIVLNVVLSRVPVRVNAAIAATAIKAAINAYSTAVTPSWFFSSFESANMKNPPERISEADYSRDQKVKFTLPDVEITGGQLLYPYNSKRHMNPSDR